MIGRIPCRIELHIDGQSELILPVRTMPSQQRPVPWNVFALAVFAGTKRLGLVRPHTYPSGMSWCRSPVGQAYTNM